MYKILIFVQLIFVTSLCYSQQIYQITASQAADLAVKNAKDLKNLELDVEIQKMNNLEVLSAVYPQISASGQATYYTNLPLIQFPTSDIAVYQVLEKEGVRDGTGNPIDISKASFGVQPVSFFAPFNTQLGINAQQLLFQPDVFIAVTARQTVLDYAQNNVDVARFKAREQVMKSYYAVLIGKKQQEVLSSSLQRLNALFREMKAMYDKGFTEKLDIDRLQVSINNTEAALNQLENGLLISESLLKNTMGLQQKDSLVLTETMDIARLQEVLLMSDTSFDYQNRPEIRLLETVKKLQDIELNRYRLATLPTVSAFYQLQRSGQRNESFDINGRGPWFWFTAGLVGLSVNQPIFSGFQRKYRMSQAKLKIQKVDNSYLQLVEAIDMERDITKRSFNNAMINVEVQQRNVDLAASVFETTKKKYQAGLGSSFELIQTDADLQRANGAYYQALYEAHTARISYLKSLGKL